jgi:hypothetical protein
MVRAPHAPTNTANVRPNPARVVKTVAIGICSAPYVTKNRDADSPYCRLVTMSGMRRGAARARLPRST